MGGDAYEVIAWARLGHTPPLPHIPETFLSQMPSLEAQHSLLLLGNCWTPLPRSPLVPWHLPLFWCLSVFLDLCLSSHLLPFPPSISQPSLTPLRCPVLPSTLHFPVFSGPSLAEDPL